MYGNNYSFWHRMLTSRPYNCDKLLKHYTDWGADRSKLHMIALRFFWQCMSQCPRPNMKPVAPCAQIASASEGFFHLFPSSQTDWFCHSWSEAAELFG